MTLNNIHGFIHHKAQPINKLPYKYSLTFVFNESKFHLLEDHSYLSFPSAGRPFLPQFSICWKTIPTLVFHQLEDHSYLSFPSAGRPFLPQFSICWKAIPTSVFHQLEDHSYLSFPSAGRPFLPWFSIS